MPLLACTYLSRMALNTTTHEIVAIFAVSLSVECWPAYTHPATDAPITNNTTNNCTQCLQIVINNEIDYSNKQIYQ